MKELTNKSLILWINMLSGEEIYVGNYSNMEKNETEYNYNTSDAGHSSITEEKDNSNISQKKKASNMLKNLIATTDVEEVRSMLRSNSYKNLISMAINLESRSDKAGLGAFCDTTFTDMRNLDEGPRLDGAKEILKARGLKLKYLRDMNSLEENQISAIQEILSDLENNREYKTQTEVEDTDLVMDFVKLGMLKRHAESLGGLKKLFSPKEKELRLKALTSQLEEHASNQYAEQIATVKEENEFRRLLKQPPVDASKRSKKAKVIRTDEVVDHNL